MADDRYDTEVNRGDLNMGALARNLNDRYEKGWALHTIFEKEGNTVIIYERRA